MQVADRIRYDHGRNVHGFHPAAIVNITNRCNLSCAHCFVYRADNPNEQLGPRGEPTDDEVLELLRELRERHGIQRMLWMGGEPLLRPGLLRQGVALFGENTITTNGTRPLIDLGPDVLYVVSLDGPPAMNDAVRGVGTFQRVIDRLATLRKGFSSRIQAQCTVTPVNQHGLEELVDILVGSRIEWITFSFVVPSNGEDSELCWATLDERMVAVEEVRRLKALYPSFVRNRSASLDLMSPELAPEVTASCLAKELVLPLWLDGDHFTTPYCCYGDDVDCSRCGAWVVFEIAARAASV